jgi:hypothetical protein
MSVLVQATDPRGASAVMLAARSAAWVAVGSAWKIPSRSRVGGYIASAWACSCQDSRYGHRCAHLIAAALVDELRSETAAF